MFPTIFPIISFFLLLLIFKVNKKVFYVVLILEILILCGGFWYIDTYYSSYLNKTLYYTALGGSALTLAFISFFIAIFSNHDQLYTDNHLDNNE